MKKTIKILIIVVSVILVLTGISLAYLYLKTDSFKSTDELFSKYANVIMEDMQDVFKDSSIENYSNRKLNNPYENEGEIEVAIQTANNSKKIDLDSTILDFNGKIDNQNNRIQEDFNIHYADNVLLPVSYVRNDNKYALTSSDIMGAYAVIENKNLKQFFDKLGINSESIPDEIEQLKLTSYIDENELQTSKQKYLTIIKNNLSSDDFSENKTTKKNGYVLTISVAKLKNILRRDTYRNERG